MQKGQNINKLKAFLGDQLKLVNGTSVATLRLDCESLWGFAMPRRDIRFTSIVSRKETMDAKTQLHISKAIKDKKRIPFTKVMLTMKASCQLFTFTVYAPSHCRIEMHMMKGCQIE